MNALAPSQVVPTPGTIFHHLTTEDSPDAEPPAAMAEAALMLCSAEPRALTGRIAYSQDLLAELARGDDSVPCRGDSIPPDPPGRPPRPDMGASVPPRR